MERRLDNVLDVLVVQEWFGVLDGPELGLADVVDLPNMVVPVDALR